jgi:hypothetical protein
MAAETQIRQLTLALGDHCDLLSEGRGLRVTRYCLGTRG